MGQRHQWEELVLQNPTLWWTLKTLEEDHVWICSRPPGWFWWHGPSVPGGLRLQRLPGRLQVRGVPPNGHQAGGSSETKVQIHDPRRAERPHLQVSDPRGRPEASRALFFLRPRPARFFQDAWHPSRGTHHAVCDQMSVWRVRPSDQRRRDHAHLHFRPGPRQRQGRHLLPEVQQPDGHQQVHRESHPCESHLYWQTVPECDALRVFSVAEEPFGFSGGFFSPRQ